MLVLPIKRKWYDMVLAGIKKEEYREIKPYFTVRFINIGLLDSGGNPTDKRAWIRYRNGYSSDSPCFDTLVYLTIGTGRKEWGAEDGVEYYRLHIVETRETL